jgi:hypothetical protein
MGNQENMRRPDPLATLTRRTFVMGLGGGLLYAASPEPVKTHINKAVRAGVDEWRSYDSQSSLTLNPESKPVTLLSDEELLPGELSVEGNHFLKPDKIRQILDRNGSPAVNSAGAFYDLGKKFGIGAAIPLAFFYQESEMGLKGVARSTKSIGNIKYTGDPFRNVEGFNGYSSYEEGLYDWFDLIRNVYINKKKLNTVEKIVPVYAPRADHNNEAAYIDTVRWCWLKWYREVNS